MRPEDKFFQTNDEKKIWERYCGFLDLSVEEFMQIQRRLLMEQIDLVADTPMGRKVMGGAKPRSVDEFRASVPLTTYDDYAEHFYRQDDSVLGEKPLYWCHSAGRGGYFKWMPYSERGFEVIARRVIALFILATTESKGQVHFKPEARILFLIPPRPYTSGCGAYYLGQQMSIKVIPPLEQIEDVQFADRIAMGFQMGLHTGVDTMFAIASVLAKTGERMAEQAKGVKLSWGLLRPPVLVRLLSAVIRSKVERRPILPKDLWKPQGILTGGTDLKIYKNQIHHYWGQMPNEVYGSTEMFTMATQAWNRQGMIFIPDTAFWEFIPEDQLKKCKADDTHSPRTVLMDEIEVGKTYEVVLTHFYGMPLLRYRMGDLITVVSVADKESGISLPQIEFKTRISDTIDIGGLTDLDEQTIWKAIEGCNIKYEDWLARKEIGSGSSYLSVYIEPKEEVSVPFLEKRIDEQLKQIDIDYRDIDTMLGIQPVKITLLSPGTFQRYYEEKQNEGSDLAHLKPPHMNASDEVTARLMQLGRA